MSLVDELNDAMEFDNRAREVLCQIRIYNSLLDAENHSWGEMYKVDVCEVFFRI